MTKILFPVASLMLFTLSACVNSAPQGSGETYSTGTYAAPGYAKPYQQTGNVERQASSVASPPQSRAYSSAPTSAVHTFQQTKGSGLLWNNDAILERNIGRRAAKLCNGGPFTELSRRPSRRYYVGAAYYVDYSVTIACR